MGEKKKLDFSGLFAIGDKAVSQPQEEKRESKTEGIAGLQREADIKELNKRVAKEIMKDVQKNIRIASQRQSEILQGLKEGDDIYSLFLKAIDVISLMTDETKTFSNQVKKDLTEIYGYGLKQKQPLSMELEEIKQRLHRLELSKKEAEATGNATACKSLTGAIDQHKRKIEEIEKIINNPLTN